MKPRKRNRAVIVVLGILVLAFVIMRIRGAVLQDEAANPSPEKLMRDMKQAVEMLQQLGYTSEIGDSKAPVKVVAYLRLSDDEHRKTAELLIPFAKQHPKEIYLTMLSMEDPTTAQKAGALGLMPQPGASMIAAQVVINNKTDFELPDAAGKTRVVSFTKRPNGNESTYRSEDVISVLEHLIAQK